MDRRYNEAEVAEILDRASRGDPTPLAPASREGLTLAEVEAIAHEVGIEADAVKAAASALPLAYPRNFPGSHQLRRSRMTRVVTLDAVPSDDDWDRMVVALREVFGVAGHVQRSGTLRSWMAPGIEVHGEPEGAGYRIRMNARDDNGWSGMVTGLFSVLSGAVMMGIVAMSGGDDMAVYVATGALMALGAGGAAWGRYHLDRWVEKTGDRLRRAVDRVRALPPVGS